MNWLAAGFWFAAGVTLWCAMCLFIIAIIITVVNDIEGKV